MDTRKLFPFWCHTPKRILCTFAILAFSPIYVEKGYMNEAISNLSTLTLPRLLSIVGFPTLLLVLSIFLMSSAIDTSLHTEYKLLHYLKMLRWIAYFPKGAKIQILIFFLSLGFLLIAIFLLWLSFSTPVLV